MNMFTLVILLALIIEFALDLAGNLLNLKAIRFEPPARLQGIYKPHEYHRSQEYLRENTRFALLVKTFELALILAIWFSGTFNWLDQIVRAWNYHPIVSGLLYIGILLMAHALLTLPFSIYATFVIEERYGFNRTSPGTFILDRVKGLGLALVMGGAMLAGILALFQYTGNFAWLYCWAVVTTFSLIMQYIAPIWIMPLFNKYTTMEPGELKDAILNYTKSVNFPLKNVLVMDGSRRSTKSNAFFTGFGKNKRIALFDTLIAQHTIPEIIAVLAHEVGHYQRKHIQQGTIITIAHTGVIFFLLSLFLGSEGLYSAFYMEQASIYAGLLFFGLLYTPLEVLLSIIVAMISRKHEHEADIFASRTTGEPGKLIDALKKLAATNLSNLTPHPFFVFLNYSHPPLGQRIEAIEKTMNKKQAFYGTI